jgi:hypothetical protein
MTTSIWGDFPAPIIVKQCCDSARAQLPQRFQKAIDWVVRACRGSSAAYLADWKRSEPIACGDDLQAEAEAERVIEHRFSDDDLDRLIRNKGLSAHADD